MPSNLFNTVIKVSIAILTWLSSSCATPPNGDLSANNSVDIFRRRGKNYEINYKITQNSSKLISCRSFLKLNSNGGINSCDSVTAEMYVSSDINASSKILKTEIIKLGGQVTSALNEVGEFSLLFAFHDDGKTSYAYFNQNDIMDIIRIKSPFIKNFLLSASKRRPHDFIELFDVRCELLYPTEYGPIE